MIAKISLIAIGASLVVAAGILYAAPFTAAQSAGRRARQRPLPRLRLLTMNFSRPRRAHFPEKSAGPCALLRLSFGERGRRGASLSGEAVARQHLLGRGTISPHLSARLPLGGSRRPDTERR